MSALFPNVPLAIGVPPVLRDAATNYDAASTLLRAEEVGGVPGSDDWGIFDRDGGKVLDPDNVVSVEHSSEFRISDYPVENGGFESYNKVQVPFEIRLAMSKGGSVTDRERFVNDLETLRASLDTYDVATPEHVYVGVNITRVGQVRSASAGAGMATVEIALQEIRQTAIVAYSSAPDATTPAPTPPTPPPPLKKGTTKAPSAVKKVNQGSVQPKQAPTIAQRYAADKKTGLLVQTPGGFILKSK